MKRFVRPAWRGVAVAAVLAVGAWLAVAVASDGEVGMGEYVDRVADAAGQAPGWLAVVVLTAMTLGGAGLLAYVARGKPPRVAVEPPQLSSWRQPAEHSASTGRTVAAPPRGRAPESTPDETTPSPPGGRRASPLDVARELPAAVRRVVGAIRWKGASAAPGRRGEAETPSDWHAVAAQVHAEVGGDWSALSQVAEGITSGHHRFAREMRAAGRPARYAAWVASALPLGAVVVSALVDPGYVQRLAADVLTVQVAGGVLLTLAGAWWLQRLAEPPFALRPAARQRETRARALCTRLEVVLERAALYAAAGLTVEEALARATRADPAGPGRRLLELLERGEVDAMSLRERETVVGRCVVGLARWRAEGAAGEDALALSAARLRLEQLGAAWPGAAGLPVTLLTPLVACILPAAALLALV